MPVLIRVKKQKFKHQIINAEFPLQVFCIVLIDLRFYST